MAVEAVVDAIIAVETVDVGRMDVAGVYAVANVDQDPDQSHATTVTEAVMAVVMVADKS